MKAKLRILTCLLLLFLGTAVSRAIVIFQDNFPYTGGPLATNIPTWIAPPGNNTATNTVISASGANTVILQEPAAAVQAWALFTNGLPGFSITLPHAGLGQGITNFIGTFYYFPSNAPVAALYASFTINVGSAITNASGTYYAMFAGTNFALHPRMYVCTNSATPGFYRMGILNNSAPTPLTNGQEIISEDLTYGTTYNVVFKQSLSTGLSTLWVGPSNPANETVTANSISPTASQSSVSLGGGLILTDTTGTNIPSFSALAGFGFHTAASIGSGAITIGSLICGTTFEDVVPASAGSNPAFIATQPANNTNFAGQSATFSVLAGGDTNGLTYQWSGPSGVISGATASSFTIPSIAPGDQGNYSVVVSNVANVTGVTSGNAFLAVLTGNAVPVINSGPANAAVASGGSTSFTVSATDGGAPLTYQWFSGSTPLASQTNATLSLTAVAFGQAGPYHVVVSNANGPTTSTNGILTVNAPATVTIAYLRSLLDNTNFNTNGVTTLFTIVGTNNTWENQTTAGNCEFNIQDGTAGMNIFWSGAAASTNFPPAGAVVQITGPLAIFDGLEEMEPVFGNPFQNVTVLSTNGILPTPQPLPFDPAVLGNPTNMQKHLMSSYFVASNVFLDTSSGPTFGDDAAEPLTNGNLFSYNLSMSSPNPGTSQTVVSNFLVPVNNQVGQTITMFYNDHVINFIGGQKPIGPCTVYGILSIHVTSVPYTSGYEFVATRLADVIPALQFTNVISNIIRYGDLATNTFTENVLQPGETLTMTVVASDPGGGNVTISGLTGSGTWSTVSGNGTKTATATYTYTGTTGAAGTADVPNMTANFSSSGFTSTYTWSIYVPTTDEQSVRITEVLPFSAGDTNSPAYNPLGRALPEVNPVANDQYVEFVNGSGDTLHINHWNIGNGGTALHTFTGGEAMAPGSAAVIYGGLLDNDVDPPNPAIAPVLEPASTGNGLTLTSSSGVITLHNNLGNLVDRVAYPAAGSTTFNSPTFNKTGQTLTNFPICSYSRFPGLNSPMVPQAFISTNYVTPGTQYDGGSWGSPTKTPTAVTGITPSVSGGSANLSFTAGTVNATTLWVGSDLTKPFSVLTGGVFPSTAGTFTISNTPSPSQFYFITTQ